jgi:hypothetical protein
MERDKVSSSYPRLKFICDWVVHGGLAGKEAQRVLIEIDETASSITTIASPGKSTLTARSAICFPSNPSASSFTTF